MRKKSIFKKFWFWIVLIFVASFGLYLFFTYNQFIKSNSFVSKNTLTDVTLTRQIEPTNNYSSLNNIVTVSNKNQKYTIQINNITRAIDENNSSAYLFLIDYTYKYLSGEDTLYISDMDFKLVDSNGEEGSSYSSNLYKYPEAVFVGESCRAQMVFSVKNPCNSVKLYYFDYFWNTKQSASFSLSI